MQDLIDALSKGWRAERSLSQMTLGSLISELDRLPKETAIENISDPHSYRGYYSDLALEKSEGMITVGGLLDVLNECLGKIFTGYKGGDFYMDINTPMWIADYGSCGVKIMGITEDGTFITAEDE